MLFINMIKDMVYIFFRSIKFIFKYYKKLDDLPLTKGLSLPVRKRALSSLVQKTAPFGKSRGYCLITVWELAKHYTKGIQVNFRDSSIKTYTYTLVVSSVCGE